MEQIIITAVFAVAAIVDFIPIIKKKEKRIYILYAVLLLASYIVLLMATYKIKIPNPMHPVDQFIRTYIL